MKKVIILISATIAVLIGIAAFFIDANAYKPEAEDAISTSLNVPVSIGQIEYFLLTPARAKVSDIKIGSETSGFYIAIDTLNLDINLLPLIGMNLSIQNLNIQNLEVAITQKGLEAFLAGLEKQDGQSSNTPSENATTINDVKINALTINSKLIDVRTSDKKIIIDDLTLDANAIALMQGGVMDTRKIIANSMINVDFIQLQEQMINDIKIHTKVADGKAKTALAANMLEGEINAELSVEFSEEIAITADNISLSGMNLQVNQALLDEFGIKLNSNPTSHETENQPTLTKPSAKEPSNLLDMVVNRLQIINTSFEYQLDPSFGLANINLDMKNIRLKEIVAQVLTQSLSANLEIADIKYKGVSLGKLVSEFTWEDTSANLSKLQILPTKGNWISIELSATSELGIDSVLTAINIENIYLDTGIIQQLFQNSPIESSGNIKFTGNITIPIKDPILTSQLGRTNGELAIVSSGLEIEGIEVDSIVNGLKESQEIGLADIGAFALTGPIGLLAGNLVDIGSGGLTTTGGTTLISGLALSANIDNGVVKVGNSAIATNDNRLAFSGGIDIANLRFQDFEFAVLDHNGCAQVKQTLNGEISNPSSAVANTLLGTVTGVASNLLNKVSNLTGSECDIFYEGEIRHPIDKR